MHNHHAFDLVQEFYFEAVTRRGRHPVEVRLCTKLWQMLAQRARDRAAEWTREGTPVDWRHGTMWLGERQQVVEAPAQVDPIVFVWAKKEAGECEHGERSEFECLPCLRVAYGKARSRESGAKWEKEQLALARQGGNDLQREHRELIGIVRGLYGRFAHTPRDQHDAEGCPFCEAEDLLGARLKPDPT